MGGKYEKEKKPEKPPVWRLGADAKVRVYPAVSSVEELSQHNADGLHEHAVALFTDPSKKRGDYSIYHFQYRNGAWSNKPLELSMAYVYRNEGPLGDYPEHGVYCAYLTNAVIDKTGEKRED